MKKALTIGELLVAMSIIGVVSVLVLPSFIQDYNKKIYVTKLRKTVAAIEAAIEQACLDNGVSYFKQTPYSFSKSKENCQEFLDKYLNKSDGIYRFPTSIYYLGKKTHNAEVNTKNTCGYTTLKDGVVVVFCPTNNQYSPFRIDINGLSSPNMSGRDVFYLSIDDKYNKLFDQQASDRCGKIGLGRGCYAKLIEDDWEMKY